MTRAEHINAHRQKLLARKAYHKRARQKYYDLYVKPNLQAEIIEVGF